MSIVYRSLGVLMLVISAAHAEDNCRAGIEAFRQRALPKAEELLKDCLPSTTKVEPYLALAALYQSQSNADALYSVALDGLAKFPEEQRFYLAVATHDGRERRYPHAIETLEAAIVRWPKEPRIQTLLASAHFGLGKDLLNAGKAGAAVPHLRRAVSLSPNDIEAQMNLGRALHNAYLRTEALTVFDALVARTPPVPLSYFHRGMCRYSMGEFTLAIDDLSKQLEQEPSYPPAQLLRGMSRMALGQWQEAAQDLDAAAGAMPENPEAQFAHARTLIEIGQLELGEEILRKAIELNTDDPAPLNALIRLLVRQGRRDEARALAPKAAAMSKKERTAAPGEIRFESAVSGKP